MVAIVSQGYDRSRVNIFYQFSERTTPKVSFEVFRESNKLILFDGWKIKIKMNNKIHHCVRLSIPFVAITLSHRKLLICLHHDWTDTSLDVFHFIWSILTVLMIK